MKLLGNNKQDNTPSNTSYIRSDVRTELSQAIK